MDYSLPGSSVHGILRARILEWVAISFSRISSQPRDWTLVSCTAGRFFTSWTTREAAILSRVSILPQTPLLSRMPHNIEQNSMCYSRSLLVIHFKYSNVYLSLPNSLTITSPHLFILATISSFCKSMSLFLFCKFISVISFYIPHIRDVIWYFSFSVWFTSLSMTVSRSIHVAADGIISFFLMSE